MSANIRELKKELDDDDVVFMMLCGISEYLINALKNFQQYKACVSATIHLDDCAIRVYHTITVRGNVHSVEYSIPYRDVECQSGGISKFVFQNVVATDHTGCVYSVEHYASTPISKYLKCDKQETYNAVQMSFFIQDEYAIIVDAYKLFKLENETNEDSLQ